MYVFVYTIYTCTLQIGSCLEVDRAEGSRAVDQELMDSIWSPPADVL